MQHARLADDPRRGIFAALSGEAAGIAVETSGSTGEPRTVLIDTQAIRASAAATAERLGGPGDWLLAIPPQRIGGALVIARAAIDGTSLVTLPEGPFTPGAFAAAARELTGSRRYTSLVPTQVARLARSAEGRAALSSFDAVLVGGAALPELGLDANLISTYGSTETCGGCVYNGEPLSGVAVATPDGRVRVAGHMLARGYADREDAAFVTEGGTRWFVTPDAGVWDGARLTIEGRADDVIITGGLKAHPARVEAALESLPYVQEAAVAGVADPEWGAKVTAWVVPSPASGIPSIGELRAELAPLLAPHELPRSVNTVAALPRTPGGKIDRRAMRTLAAGEE
jgi:O-succinylbenzoic acid--CoA ligase